MGSTNLDPPRSPRLRNAIQRYLVERTRLGIPAIVHEESLHGVMGRDAPCYQQSIGAAASWDPALGRAMAATIRRRMLLRAPGRRSRPSSTSRATRVGPDRGDLRGGPVPGGRARLAYVRGNPGAATSATGSSPRASTWSATASPRAGSTRLRRTSGPRELRDELLFPFEAAVRRRGIASVMQAYGDLDGVPCVASRELLTTILRDEWGFDGIVASDYMGIEMLVDRRTS